jgi:hypothetical protein
LFLHKDESKKAKNTLMGNTSNEIKKTRLISLDALRGFDMFWIIGGSGMLVSLVKVLGFPENWVN